MVGSTIRNRLRMEHPLAKPRPRKPVQAAEERQILLAGQLRVERERLGSDADEPADGGPRGVFVPVQVHRPLVGTDQP